MIKNYTELNHSEKKEKSNSETFCFEKECNAFENSGANESVIQNILNYSKSLEIKKGKQVNFLIEQVKN